MKVLIGLDDSAQAEASLEFVRKMTWPAGTSMVVVSAVPLPFGAYAETYAPVAVELDSWLKELTRLHEDVASRAVQKLVDAGLQARSRVLQGDPRDVLLEEARQERADLIVVGSHGRTGIGKLLMGSVASHVVSHAPCSVMVVRQGAPAGR